jgi:hypothetical protein
MGLAVAVEFDGNVREGNVSLVTHPPDEHQRTTICLTPSNRSSLPESNGLAHPKREAALPVASQQLFQRPGMFIICIVSTYVGAW